MSEIRPSSQACPHCNQTPAKERWPLCSWCGLFLVEMEELDLSPEAELVIWRKQASIKWVS